METPHIPIQKISKNFKKKNFPKNNPGQDHNDTALTHPTWRPYTTLPTHTDKISKKILADSSKKTQPGETIQEGTPE
jgi:phenylalanyl-tRNA synthetase alpha subunit